MKNFITVFLFISFLYSQTAFAQAQKGQSNITFSEGIFSTTFVYAFLDRGLGSTENNRFSGSTNIGYKYFISSRMAIGLAIGTEAYKGQFVGYSGPNNSSVVVGDYKIRFTTIAPEFYYLWANRKWFTLYGLVGIGYSFSKEKDEFVPGYHNSEVGGFSRDHFNFQFTPIGVRYGRKFGGFLELGIGYRGLLNLGVSYKF